MRVLVSCRSYAGHFLPMLPLARALLEAGHDVGCASGHDVEALAQGHGLMFWRAGPGQMTAAERVTVFPEVSSLSPVEIRSFTHAAESLSLPFNPVAPGGCTGVIRELA